MTRKVPYDSVELDDATGFRVSYAKGEHVKISDGVSTIVVYKPGRCPTRNGQAYKNGVVQFSGSGTNVLAYRTMVDVFALVEKAIEMLNLEEDGSDPSAVFDRAASDNLDEEPVRKLAVHKPRRAIPAKGHVVGHIYEDDNRRCWVWLGKAEVREKMCAYPVNRAGCRFAYIEYRPDLANIVKTGDNEYEVVPKDTACLPFHAEHVDTFANRKRHMKDVGSLEGCDPSKPIVMATPFGTYTVTADRT